MKIKLTEVQLTKIYTQLKEQGLYGNQSDVVDYDLPEYFSDVIILGELNEFPDVKNAIKELHKRLIRLEKGLTNGGSHNKAYSTDTEYSSKNKRFKDIESHQSDEDERDDKIEQEIERIRQQFIDDLPKSETEDL